MGQTIKGKDISEIKALSNADLYTFVGTLSSQELLEMSLADLRSKGTGTSIATRLEALAIANVNHILQRDITAGTMYVSDSLLLEAIETMDIPTTWTFITRTVGRL